MSLPDLVVMMGLPRSGKSTIVKELYVPNGWAVVCPDIIRLAVHGQAFYEGAEPLVWAFAGMMVDVLRASGNRVVVDATNGRREHRRQWVKRGAVWHVVNTSKDECLERITPATEYLIPVINRMAKNWEPLNLKEGKFIEGYRGFYYNMVKQ